MEILRRCTPSENNIWIGECRVCKSIAQCKEKELKNIEPGDRTTDHEAFAWRTCPVCKAGIGSTKGYGGMLFHNTNSVSGKKLAKELRKGDLDV